MNQEKFQIGERVQIETGVVEFNVKGNTIWIQSPQGGTTMRIKCTGQINIEQCEISPLSHCDIIVQGDINFCLSQDAQ